jgi:CRP/FNR family transcriptional regulator
MSATKMKNKILDLKPPIINNPLSEIIVHSEKKRILTFKKDEFLFHEGDKAEGIHFIITGKIKIAKHDLQNHPSILYFAQRGDTLGIHAVVNDHEMTNSAVSLVKSYTCFIPTYEFLDLIEKDSKYKFLIMQMLCTKIDLLENKMSSQFVKSIPERLIESLMFLIQTYGMDENTYFYHRMILQI